MVMTMVATMMIWLMKATSKVEPLELHELGGSELYHQKDRLKTVIECCRLQHSKLNGTLGGKG